MAAGCEFSGSTFGASPSALTELHHQTACYRALFRKVLGINVRFRTATVRERF